MLLVAIKPIKLSVVMMNVVAPREMHWSCILLIITLWQMR